MKPRVTIKDKTFELSIPEEKILEAVDKCAKEINADYAGKNPIFVIVLGGAFIFGADLVRRITIPCQIAFVKFASYEGTSTTNVIKEQLPASEDFTGRHIIIVEDIVETGKSMEFLKKRLEPIKPASIEICALSFKPEKCEIPDLKIKYVGMQLPEAFIVGYGLDYNSFGRNLKDIYSLI
jgi:hypoxanthine phosphoribosyltransferase